MSRAAAWYRCPGNRLVAAHLPVWCVRAVFYRGSWPGIPRLRDADLARPGSRRADGCSVSRWTFTQFPHVKRSHDGERVSVDRNELVERIRAAEPIATTKANLPVICTATFANEHRTKANVQHLDTFGIDDDNPCADPQAWSARVHAALGGVEVFTYSTASSLPDAYKMRALIPYDRAVSGVEHELSWVLVARLLARQGIVIDTKCYDASRAFYIWAVPKNGAYFNCHLDGEPWPIEPAVMHGQLARELETQRKRISKGKRPLRAKPRASSDGERLQRASAYLAQCEPAIAGQDGSGATLKTALKLLDVIQLTPDEALEIMRVEYNNRCRPPWSEKELVHKVREAEKIFSKRGTK